MNNTKPKFSNLIKLLLLSGVLIISTIVSAKQIDPRLRDIAPVLQQIATGEKIAPIQVDINQYIYILGIKSLREKLKPHMVIYTPSGEKMSLVEGNIPKKIGVPFYELIRMYQKAYASNKKGTISFLKNNLNPLPISINKILYRYTERAPFSQVSIGKMLKDLSLDSLTEGKYSITLMQLYFAIGGRIKALDGKDVFSYITKAGECFIIPPKESICINNKILAKGISRALSANIGLRTYESKSEFNKTTQWRVAQ